MTQALPPSRLQQSMGKLLVVVALLAMMAYPAYRVLVYGTGHEQLDRHRAFLNKTSMFYNPWQYRPLAPLLNEAVYQVVEPVVNLVPFQRVFHQYDRTKVNYYVVFVGMRMLQVAVIFYLCYLYYRRLQISLPFIGMGFLYLTFSFGNAVANSDFSFNTYYDVIFYLLAAWLVLKEASPYWLVPLAAVAAFNRETAGLIPALLLWRAVDWASLWPQLKTKPAGILRTIHWRFVPPMLLSLVVFGAVVVAVRGYYGPPPANLTGPSFNDYWFQPGWRMLARNILRPEAQAEVWGVLTFLPLLSLYYLKRTSPFLRFLFVLILAFWLPIHYWQVMVQEARLFLVPLVVIFLPMSLQIAQQLGRNALVPPQSA
ncbi:MAG: hypothetical protein MUC97_17755 [Bernardetiaceae bacterium]|jgi:hypothetical protein|nr:hypothetical protein [Bernardetiaceae bacterium]